MQQWRLQWKMAELERNNDVIYRPHGGQDVDGPEVSTSELHAGQGKLQRDPRIRLRKYFRQDS
jgi:hypothetical protein